MQVCGKINSVFSSGYNTPACDATYASFVHPDYEVVNSPFRPISAAESLLDGGDELTSVSQVSHTCWTGFRVGDFAGRFKR